MDQGESSQGLEECSRAIGQDTADCDMHAQKDSRKAEGSLHARTRPHLPAGARDGRLCRVSSNRRVRIHFVFASFQVGCLGASFRWGVTAHTRTHRPHGRWQIDDGARARMLQNMQQNLRQQRHNTALGKHKLAKYISASQDTVAQGRRALRSLRDRQKSGKHHLPGHLRFRASSPLSCSALPSARVHTLPTRSAHHCTSPTWPLPA